LKETFLHHEILNLPPGDTKELAFIQTFGYHTTAMYWRRAYTAPYTIRENPNLSHFSNGSELAFISKTQKVCTQRHDAITEQANELIQPLLRGDEPNSLPFLLSVKSNLPTERQFGRTNIIALVFLRWHKKCASHDAWTSNKL
jgi:hypothetical protein